MIAFDPRNLVVFITSNNPGGEQGSGVLISPDEILTASHVAENWDIPSGQALPAPATNIVVTPANHGGVNPFTPAGPFGSFTADAVHYNDVSTVPFSQQYLDFAIIHLSKPVTGAGYMGLSPTFAGGAVTFSGFPASYDAAGHYQAGHQVNVDDTLTHSPSNMYWSDVHLPGASGGPSWIMTADGPEVVAVMSGIYAGATGFQTTINAGAINEIELWQAQDGESPAIARLYHAILGRAPDAPGLKAWSDLLLADAGTVPTNGAVITGQPGFHSGAEILLQHPDLVTGFLGSAEFLARGPLTDAQFVTDLYLGALGRAPDAAGLRGWDSVLDSHAWSRSAVAIGIAESNEAISHMTIYGSVA